MVKAEETAVQNEENKKDEEKARSAKKKPSVFKRWYDSFMNMGENFFDDKDEAQQNVNNGN